MNIKATSPRELFAQFLAESPPEEWDARLAAIRQQDAALADRVENLLQAHQDPQSFLDRPLSPTVSFSESPSIGAQIGPYRLREQIGEGGFGVVFMAEQLRPVRRKVALKVLKPGMDTRQVIARFEAERQALALMDHPNIARILDAGTTDEAEGQGSRVEGTKSLIAHPSSLIPRTGRPYFVMELVKGIPITEYCDQQRLSTGDRLTLFVDVCHAVQHAKLAACP